MSRLPPNPWLATPRRPSFILPADRPAIRAFNGRAKRSRYPERYQIIEELLPVPFIGDPAAPVVLLSLNPGFDPNQDFKQQDRSVFRQALRACYAHKKTKHPFFFLDPQVGGGFGGESWWRQVFA